MSIRAFSDEIACFLCWIPSSFLAIPRSERTQSLRNITARHGGRPRGSIHLKAAVCISPSRETPLRRSENWASRLESAVDSPKGPFLTGARIREEIIFDIYDGWQKMAFDVGSSSDRKAVADSLCEEKSDSASTSRYRV
jgi:hypothetical protein